MSPIGTGFPMASMCESLPIVLIFVSCITHSQLCREHEDKRRRIRMYFIVIFFNKQGLIVLCSYHKCKTNRVLFYLSFVRFYFLRSRMYFIIFLFQLLAFLNFLSCYYNTDELILIDKVKDIPKMFHFGLSITQLQ